MPIEKAENNTVMQDEEEEEEEMDTTMYLHSIYEKASLSTILGKKTDAAFFVFFSNFVLEKCSTFVTIFAFTLTNTEDFVEKVWHSKIPRPVTVG
ncbi:hypothetical protein T08_16420 [Trichinella sp. T8]|nr:hypothetical protein T08_16420 [Trichinella sp. T8]